MNRKLLTSFMAAAASSATLLAQQPKNVLLIMADDMGAMELGCYGNDKNITPNLDALARSGCRINTFFATPVSTPSRVALMTGKYGIHTGHLAMADQPGGKGRGYDLSSDEYTFGQMFRDAGYATAIAGKWQLSGEGETLVRDCGFDEYMIWIYKGMLGQGVAYRGGFEDVVKQKTSRYWQPDIMVNGAHPQTQPTEYGPDMYSEFLIDFIEKNAARKTPFFAYYPMTLVHAPWLPTPDHPDVQPNSPEAFKANVEYCDKIIGRLIAALDDAGVRENTLVLFIGDNGTQDRGKATVTEWGPHTPCLISCPETIQAGVVSDALADIPDILATMLDFADYTPHNFEDLDGKSLMPVLTGKTVKHEEFAVSYYGNYRIIRTDNWLLEANNDESFGRMYYCGENRNGDNYKRITDYSEPSAKAAKARFEKFIKDNWKPLNMTDDDRQWFTDFVTKNGERMKANR